MPMQLAHVAPQGRLHRIVSLDTCPMSPDMQICLSDGGTVMGIVVVGGSRGGVEAFQLISSTSSVSGSNEVQLTTWCTASKVHDVTPVRHVRIVEEEERNEGERAGLRVVTAGGDSAVVQFKVDPVLGLVKCRCVAANACIYVFRMVGRRSHCVPMCIQISRYQMGKCFAGRNDSTGDDHHADSAHDARTATGWAGAPRLIHGFQGADFVAFSVGDDCEVVRVACAEWRRVSAAAVKGVNDVTLAFVKGGRIMMHRRRSLKRGI